MGRGERKDELRVVREKQRRMEGEDVERCLRSERLRPAVVVAVVAEGAAMVGAVVARILVVVMRAKDTAEDERLV